MSFSLIAKVAKMPDYSKAKIYCIKSSQTDKVYYGSTCVSLNERFRGHKCDSNIKTVTSSQIFQYTDAYIELVEEFPCNTKTELHTRERYYIENYPCVNKFIPGRSRKEICDASNKKRKEYQRLYYLSKKNNLALSKK